MSLTFSVILDTRRIKQKTQKYPVKLRVIHDREPSDYTTIYDLAEAEFKKLSVPNIGGTLREVRDKLRSIERAAGDVAEMIDPFKFAKFERDFVLNNPEFVQRKALTNAKVTPVYAFDTTQYEHRFPIFREKELPADTMLVVFRSYIDKLLRADRIGTATSYQTAYYSLARFRGNVRFSEITVEYLKEFESWMFRQDYSKTTVGIYTRSLRAIFNEAIEDGIVRREKYPFGKRRYQAPTSRNIKKALKLEDVAKIYYYEPVCEQEARARDFWLFSYLANGMNPKDIALLKWKTFDEEYFYFERAKTETTTRSDPKPITVYITEDIKAIIERWGNEDKDPNGYVFQILQAGITPLRQYELIELFIRSINEWLVKIKKKLGIDKSLTTYVARHTFATILKRSGASTEFIQESLGHADKRTTENYLDSFDNSVRMEFSKKLIQFKKNELQ